MAGDWIKMRVDLYRDPKVSLMADFLNAHDSQLSESVNQITQRDSNVTRNVMRNATVGALVSVWGVARVQGKRVGDDLLLAGMPFDVIDDMADIAGFGQAMASVGWVEKNGKDLIFPRFFEDHNADYETQKRLNRERQARYRERKNSQQNSNVTVTLRNAPREEKRREEKKEETPFPPYLDFPDFIAAWSEWIAYRKERRLPKLQKRSIMHQFEEFEKWGKDAAIEAIRQSIRNNWQGIFAPKNGTPTNGQLKKPRCLTDEEIRTGTYNPLTGFTPARAQ